MASIAPSLRIAAAVLLASLAARADTNITRASVSSAGVEGNNASSWQNVHSLSADGRFVAFESEAWNLVSGDVNNSTDVFVHDRTTGATVRVSVDSSGNAGDAASVAPSISGDGRFVAFESYATNLVANDTNASPDILVHDRDPDLNGVFDEGNGVTVRASVDGAGVEGDNWSRTPSISADGGRVAFHSLATNLVAGDGNGRGDVFVRDLVAGTTTRASVDSSGNEGNTDSFSPAISDDGAVVVFCSYSTNLVAGDTNGSADVFAHTLSTAVTERVSVDSTGKAWGGDSPFRPAISSDGAIVAFFSYAPLSGGVSAQVFVRDRTAATTEIGSLDTQGLPAGSREDCSLSDDGNLVVFSTVKDGVIPDDDNGFIDVYVRDRAAATTRIASWPCARKQGNDQSFWGVVSGDGSAVAFTSYARKLVTGDTNGFQDVFVNDQTMPDPDASWSNYGSGFPGTLGVPTLTSSADPEFGTVIRVLLGNSYGPATSGYLLIGVAPANLSTGLGGTLLVDPIVVVPLVIPSAGASHAYWIPYLDALCDLHAYLQGIEADPGALKGWSFSPGLELILGR